MRSRYSAFVVQESEYLLSSWHPSTRPTEINLEDDPIEWIGLEIETSRGEGSDQQGEVTFKARFNHQGEIGELYEKSRFVHQDGRWFYLDGEQLSNEKIKKVGRNSLCPCGSRKKYKRCCGG